MCRTFAKSLFVFALFSAASVSAADVVKNPIKDRLPYQDKWNLIVFEQSSAFEVVKRTVKDNVVTWVLENKRGLGTEVIFGYHVDLLDHDGIKLRSLGFEITPSIMNLGAGERNKFVLHLPPELNWNLVGKLVIMNGNMPR